MILSWGRVHREEHLASRPQHLDCADPAALAEKAANGRVLAHGMGRSYGDSPLNGGGALLITRALDRVLAVDWTDGWLRAEAGLTLDALLQLSVPKGWFPAVVPGTKFVTLGGAVAHDIHGKNHHQVGSFGAHVRKLGLRRSDGNALTLGPKENPELFRLTIGGLGLTGLITWVEIQLVPIPSAELEVEIERFDHIDAFFDLSLESHDWPYTVAWIDCFAPQRQLGRGLFSRARFAYAGSLAPHRPARLAWPVESPAFLLNRTSVAAFNLAYRKLSRTGKGLRQHYDRFFFPLDGVRAWNKLYGAKGFFQHQSLLPPDRAHAGITRLLEEIRAEGQGSFLAVLKSYGPEHSPGRLSFASEGVSLALDFANKGSSTRALLARLDAIVREANGRIYPAKDGLMDGDFFQESYPAWTELEAQRDPAFSSSFWRRVTGMV